MRRFARPHLLQVQGWERGAVLSEEVCVEDPLFDYAWNEERLNAGYSEVVFYPTYSLLLLP